VQHITNIEESRSYLIENTSYYEKKMSNAVQGKHALYSEYNKTYTDTFCEKYMPSS
jgi:hypothetical protein